MLYLYSSPFTYECQQITNFQNYALGQLKLSDVSLFMLGVDPSNFSFHMFKITFSSISPDWALKMTWSLLPWSTSYSSSIQISSSIYSLFAYGNSTYLYLATMSLADGSVTTRYKSTITWNQVIGAATNGDYIASSSWNYIVLYRISTSIFIIKSFSGGTAYGWEVEPTTGR